ncbi:MerR family transcriptional regulator [Microbacterium sp. NPDC056234]|uniref:MerR family transcriptional regulator n=1 Tax=Microbacterium sp. NPDC056234 TaxID=3345757 RepID=UPI0035D87510
MLIGEVARRSGVSRRMLRHYDRIGLVSPSERTHGGYREYSDQDVQRLFHVEGLRSLGLGLQEISDALADLSFSPAEMIDRLIARTQERLARDTELLRNLSRVQASGPGDWSGLLRTVGLIRGLDVEDASSRQRLALSLDASDAQNAVPLLEAALNETDPNAAGALDWALARLPEAAVRHLAEALDSPIAARRLRATEALRKSDSPSASQALAAAFGNSDPVVHARAAIERGRRGEDDAIPALVALIVEGRDDVEASDALALLAKDPDGAGRIAEAITTELGSAGPAERRRLTAALADIPGRAVDDLLTALKSDPDPGVSATAAYIARERLGVRPPDPPRRRIRAGAQP